MTDPNPVAHRLTELIAKSGPVSVATFMEIALADPDGGYYMTRDPLGAAGDFTTAPEISQMFGELIGLWCADTWQRLGAPDAFALIEFGPGRGTLMADALRAMATVPACRAAARVQLVETSPVLRDAQAAALSGADPTWHDTLPASDGMPTIVIANEFLDALPVRQFVKSGGRWRERLVTTGPAGRFAFILGDDEPDVPEAPRLLEAALDGEILETSPAIASVVGDISARIGADGGVALIIDYGHPHSAVGDTLQAVRRHRPVDPLDAPGTADLTAHVDFARVASTAASTGLRSWGPVTQGAFLAQLGIHARADALRAGADTRQQRDIDAALARLIGPAEMGTLFKVLALSEQWIDRLAGFDPGP